MSEVTIFMPLLDEGTEVWRPVAAERLGGDRFRVLGPAPEDEQWAFPPGTVVRGLPRTFQSGSEGIAAVSVADDEA